MIKLLTIALIGCCYNHLKDNSDVPLELNNNLLKIAQSSFNNEANVESDAEFDFEARRFEVHTKTETMPSYDEDQNLVEKVQYNNNLEDCVLTVTVAPEHGFVSMNCQNGNALSYTTGFYPTGGQLEKVSAFMLGNFLGIEAFKIMGNVVDDTTYNDRCNHGELACAKADFVISRESADNVWNYIEDIKESCSNQDISKCSYSLLGGNNGLNCIDFAAEVSRVANIQENVFEKLEVYMNPNSLSFERRLFSLADKAWKYIFLKTYGQVNIKP